MKTFNANRKLVYLLAVVALSLTGLALGTKLTRARTLTSSITIVNNSSKEIRHLFLSAPDSKIWSDDQLQDSTTITPSQSFTVSNVSCPEANIKVIAEDQDGCFLYQVVSCASEASWTITNDATPDCGN
jgi:hypothetical protein